MNPFRPTPGHAWNRKTEKKKTKKNNMTVIITVFLNLKYENLMFPGTLMNYNR